MLYSAQRDWDSDAGDASVIVNPRKFSGDGSVRIEEFVDAAPSTDPVKA